MNHWLLMQVNEKVESRLMSEMRQHLVEMNRKKMLDRGLITERELAIIGDYHLPTIHHHRWTGGSSQRGNWQSLVISISLRNHHQNAGWEAHHWGKFAISDDYSSSSPSYKSSSLTNMIIISGKYSSLTGLATMDFSSETANSAHSSSSSQVDQLIFK